MSRISLRRVSILTRPGGRVQPMQPADTNPLMGFQSSPVPEDGCNSPTKQPRRRGDCFNPHPSRRTGATSVCLPRGVPIQFQSSPVPEDGCNQLGSSPNMPSRVFQSSPVPEDGCNDVSGMGANRSISGFNPHPSRRTGATGGVRRETAISRSVSILTRPGGRVQQCFAGRTEIAQQPFQSSPVPEDGCNAALAPAAPLSV